MIECNYKSLCTKLNPHHTIPKFYKRHHKLVKIMRIPDPVNTELRPALPFGLLLVAEPPRYQLPISVSLPSCVSIAAFGPTFETSLRKDPKYE